MDIKRIGSGDEIERPLLFTPNDHIFDISFDDGCLHAQTRNKLERCTERIQITMFI